jgi:hypothetical protein
MTEKKTEIKRETWKDTSAQEQKLENEQLETGPIEGDGARQELAGTSATEADDRKIAGVLAGAAKAIEGGVGYVGERAPKVASFVVHKVKKGVSVAYGTSSAFVQDAYHRSSEYADKYKHKAEIKRLKGQRDAVTSRLGSLIYTKIVIDDESPEKVFSEQRISSILQQIEDLDKEVVKIGRGLEEH